MKVYFLLITYGMPLGLGATSTYFVSRGAVGTTVDFGTIVIG